MLPTAALAHSPHDEILALQFSPRFAVDLLVFAIVRFNLIRSVDRGLTWLRSTRGLAGIPLVDVAVSPNFAADHAVLTASSSHGIRRSLDGGQSWHAVPRPPEALQLSSVRFCATSTQPHAAGVIDHAGGLWLSADGGSEWHRACDESVAVTSLASTSDALLVGTRTGQILRSADGGSTWQPLFQLPHRAGVTALAVTKNAEGESLIAFGAERQGVFVLRLAHGRPQMLPRSLRRRWITSLAWARTRTGGPQLFATTWKEGVYRSSDLGHAWTLQADGLSTDPQADDPGFRSPHFRSIQASPTFAEDSTLMVAGFDGLFVSSNGGDHWTERRSVLPINLVVGLDVASSKLGSVAVALSTYGGGPQLTLDAGIDWRGDRGGLHESRTFGIALSPNFARDSSVFVASNWALYRSPDAGVTWLRTPFQPRRARGGAAMALLTGFRTLARVVSRRLGAAPYRQLRRSFHRMRGGLGLRLPLPGFGALLAVSRTFDRDACLFVAAGDSVWRSTDAGASLTSCCALRDHRIRTIAVSPNHAHDRTVLVAAGERLRWSEDSGATWSDRWTAAGAPIRTAAFSTRFADDHTIFVAVGSRLFRSRNAGRDWEFLSALELAPEDSIEAVLPTDTAADGGPIFVNTGGGLFRSDDGGLRFTALATGAPSFSPWQGFPDQAPLVCLSPAYQQDRTICAASHDQLWISQDQGETWSIATVPARYDAVRPEISYRGKWVDPSKRTPSAAAARRAERTGAAARLEFVGTGVRWLGQRGPANGAAEVWIDGHLVEQVDQFAVETARPGVSYQTTLPLGHHSIEIRAANGAATSGRRRGVVLHAFEVLPPRTFV